MPRYQATQTGSRANGGDNETVTYRVTKISVPRSESQRERDRLKVSELYLQGWTQGEIAAELGISRKTVNLDVKFLLTEWRKRRDNITDDFASKYSYIYREAVTAWHRSKEDAETTTQEMIDTGESVSLDKDGRPLPSAQRLKASTRKEGQSGNPALLAQAQGALKAIREMFGVDAQKVPGSSEDTPLVVKFIKGIDPNAV